MMRTVTKLVTSAKNEGHACFRPLNNERLLVAGSRKFNTSNVMANAKTPSLKASILAVSFS